MNKTKFISMCVTLLLFAGCASTTTYKLRTAIVGYTDQHKFMNKYQVSFRGGKNTPMKQVWEWAYKRAAEVTIENGYRYFIVTDESEHYYRLSEDAQDQDSLTKGFIEIKQAFFCKI